jgi:endonuclease YncB( thermonuclease family)
VRHPAAAKAAIAALAKKQQPSRHEFAVWACAYHAAVLKVVDGDTLWVKVYLHPGHWVKQKLRLRDLDCPEMDTAEGKAAKRFVETLVAQAVSVTICTTKPDKYDRYLADVYLLVPDGQRYLNNELLANGHAARKNDYSPEDWDDK